jgi:2-polyprenyl-3-methyl-5-hydroxy-6-metoxy-1,4-benzoquinol methylase
MNVDYEKEYLIAEQTHPWFVRRRELIYQLVSNLPKNARILEVGCGSGINLLMLQNKGFTDLTGVEPSAGMKQNIGIPIFNNLDQICSSFDVILLLDVLEHIPNDSAMLRQLERIMADTGKIIITVPAFKFLWSIHDELNKHYRRYNKKMLRIAVRNVRLKTTRIFYWNFCLFPAIALIKILKKSTRQTKSDISPMSSWSAAIYSAILHFENFVIKHDINPLFGISLIAILKKSRN